MDLAITPELYPHGALTLSCGLDMICTSTSSPSGSFSKGFSVSMGVLADFPLTQEEFSVGKERFTLLKKCSLHPEEESSAKTSDETKSKDKVKGQIEEEENRALKSINETSAQKAAKRRRLNQVDKDVEEIKQHLEIVPDEDDDIYTQATPLTRKVLVVDYEIVHLNNKPRYKIIRADETHQLSLKKNTKCVIAAGEELSAVKYKLMLLDTAAERS
nr:hypothetical protein [Tanacetum cinerariifolium]